MFKEGQILDFTLLKKLEFNGVRNFLMQAPNGKKLLIPAAHYTDYHFKIGQVVRCKIDRINCSGQVFLEPLNPKYEIDKVYQFLFVGCDKVKTILDEQRYFFKVKDVFGRINKVISYRCPKVSINDFVDCRVLNIKKGQLTLYLAQDINPLYLGNIYAFEIIEKTELQNLGECMILRDPFGGKHFYPNSVFEHYEYQAGQLIRGRVEGYSRMGDFKIEPLHPLYRLGKIYKFEFLRKHKEEIEGAETQTVLVVKDEKGTELIDMLKSYNLSGDGILQSNTRKTTTKFRILGNNTQILRVDEEILDPITKAERMELIGKIGHILEKQKIDAIIFEDYDKGVISKELIADIAEMAGQKGIIVTADPKMNNFLHYKNITLLKPNLKELNQGLNLQIQNGDITAIAEASKTLKAQLGLKQVMVTLSEHGVYIVNDTEEHLIPAHVRNISDVSGAGDTVISVLTMMLATGASLHDAASMANLAGGLVCEEVGVVPIRKDVLLSAVKKI